MTQTSSDILEIFANFYTENKDSDIIITGNHGIHNENFLNQIAKFEFFEKKKILTIRDYNHKAILKKLAKNENEKFDVIIFFGENLEPQKIKEILTEKHISGQIIMQNRAKNHDDFVIFEIPETSFRDYSKAKNAEFSIAQILKKEVDFEELENLANNYLKSGAFAENMENPDEIIANFDKKRTIIKEEIFEKEYEIFDNFIHALALENGQLFKEDQFAKNLNTSRRKIKKFTEILEKYGIIHSIEPFVTNPEKELTRHKKYYFGDLAFYRAAMGENYGIGTAKEKMIENFVFLELERKLDETHELLFWQKKSGTNIAFILKNKSTNRLTPIEIHLGNSQNPTLTMKSFYESYSSDIEHAMMLTENTTKWTNLNDKSFLILPFYTI